MFSSAQGNTGVTVITCEKNWPNWAIRHFQTFGVQRDAMYVERIICDE